MTTEPPGKVTTVPPAPELTNPPGKGDHGAAGQRIDHLAWELDRCVAAGDGDHESTGESRPRPLACVDRSAREPHLRAGVDRVGNGCTGAAAVDRVVVPPAGPPPACIDADPAATCPCPSRECARRYESVGVRRPSVDLLRSVHQVQAQRIGRVARLVLELQPMFGRLWSVKVDGTPVSDDELATLRKTNRKNSCSAVSHVSSHRNATLSPTGSEKTVSKTKLSLARSVSSSRHPPDEPPRTVRLRIPRPAIRIDESQPDRGQVRVEECGLPGSVRTGNRHDDRPPIELGKFHQGHGTARNSRPTNRPTVRVPSTSTRTSNPGDPGTA